MVSKTWLRLAIPAVLVALGATACSGDNTKQLDAWATTLCGSMQGPVQQSNAALADTGTVKPGETPAALQTRLAADLGTLATANTQIAQAVQKAGAPKVDNGAQTQAAAVTELNQAAGGYTSVQQAVSALPVDDQAKFAAGLKGVGDKVQQLAELSTSALQKLQAGALGTALAKQPGCKSTTAAATGTAAPVPSASGPAATGSASASTGYRTGSSAAASAKPGGSGSAAPDASASAH
ncbi:small secreted protein [Streptacidiphilus sp. PB12-B1b]|uniref:small secreted protein n=1 Tax=Streptacidiphilus sp. PB12-B1b TaxID=2705012 RepID=UPI0015FDAA8B|nr:small secreted protein [Streptacidiphilus sp. PB12-B1b]QMU74684.1 small secreted protein [Streptacidiphilus sp. PB12-B1b]